MLHVTTHGNHQHLLAAFAALQTVLPKNFKMTDDFGQPFKITDGGKCTVVCNAAGWVAQHPHFKSLGLKFGETQFGSAKKVMPTFKTDAGGMAYGYNALAYALGADLGTVNQLFSPHFYPTGEATTIEDVLKRLKGAIAKPKKVVEKPKKSAKKSKKKAKKG